MITRKMSITMRTAGRRGRRIPRTVVHRQRKAMRKTDETDGAYEENNAED